jgi:MFS family permease
LCGYTATNTLGYMTVIYSFSAFAVSLGYTQEQGGNIIAILNVGTALGRPLIGVVSDYWGRITTACVITVVNALLAFAFWIPVTTYAPLVVLALVYGGTCGVFWAVSVYLVASSGMLGMMNANVARV